MNLPGSRWPIVSDANIQVSVTTQRGNRFFLDPADLDAADKGMIQGACLVNGEKVVELVCDTK